MEGTNVQIMRSTPGSRYGFIRTPSTYDGLRTFARGASQTSKRTNELEQVQEVGGES